MSTVTLPRPGLVHDCCPYCIGGEVDGPENDYGRCAPQRCTYCGGRGYVVREAPRDPVADLVGQIIDGVEARMDAAGIPGGTP